MMGNIWQLSLGFRFGGAIALSAILLISMPRDAKGYASELSNMTIIAQGEVKPNSLENLSRLSDAEVAKRLQALPNWKTDGKSISYTHEFKNFVEAINFVNCLASPAEKANHHPDLAIAYNRVTITLTTHDAGGLTDKDFELAQTISKLIREWMSNNVCLLIFES